MGSWSHGPQALGQVQETVAWPTGGSKMVPGAALLSGHSGSLTSVGHPFISKNVCPTQLCITYLWVSLPTSQSLQTWEATGRGPSGQGQCFGSRTFPPLPKEGVSPSLPPSYPCASWWEPSPGLEPAKLPLGVPGPLLSHATPSSTFSSECPLPFKAWLPALPQEAFSHLNEERGLLYPDIAGLGLAWRRDYRRSPSGLCCTWHCSRPRYQQTLEKQRPGSRVRCSSDPIWIYCS